MNSIRLLRQTRPFISSSRRLLSTTPKPSNKPKREMVSITFVAANGEKQTVKGFVDDSILDTAHDNDIEIEGACGGEMACSTCT
jgi:hypothetical protein